MLVDDGFQEMGFLPPQQRSEAQNRGRNEASKCESFFENLYTHTCPAHTLPGSTHTCAFPLTRTLIHLHPHACTQTHLPWHAHTPRNRHTRTHTHAYTRRNRHTRTHACIHTQKPPRPHTHARIHPQKPPHHTLTDADNLCTGSLYVTPEIPNFSF